MNYSKLIIAGIAAGLIMFIVDGLWWMVIFKDFYLAHTPPRGPENIPLHGIASLCLGLLMAAIYPIGYKGGSAIMEGSKFGLMIGLIISLPNAIHQYAGLPIIYMVPVTFIINGILIGILGGITIAMIYGSKSAVAKA